MSHAKRAIYSVFVTRTNYDWSLYQRGLEGNSESMSLKDVNCKQADFALVNANLNFCFGRIGHKNILIITWLKLNNLEDAFNLSSV